MVVHQKQLHHLFLIVSLVVTQLLVLILLTLLNGQLAAAKASLRRQCFGDGWRATLQAAS